MFTLWAFLILFATTPNTSYALEWLPEYQSLTEAEEVSFEGPDRLGSEYQSSVLAYTKPDSYESLWLNHEKAFDLSIGSTGSRHFLIDNRLKVHQDLSDSLQFRFTYTDERNREREALHHILELVFWPNKHFGISLYGEPSLYKRENDTGIAFLWKPHARHEIRIFNTFVDVTRLRRNDRADTYDENFLPYSRGLVGRLWSPVDRGDFLEYAARYDTHTKWLFKAENYQYEYWKAFASLYVTKTLQPNLRLLNRTQADRKFESKSGALWRTDRLFINLEFQIPRFGPANNLEWISGIEYAYRKWDTTAGEVRYHDLLPHFWLWVPAFKTSKERDRVGIGYTMTWHRVIGTRAFLGPQDDDGAIEQRINLSYDFRLNNWSELRLEITGDLDEMGTRRSWEGGNGQFRAYF